MSSALYNQKSDVPKLILSRKKKEKRKKKLLDRLLILYLAVLEVSFRN
jgi:hypothetical protein